jgi:hypothetical protein
MKLDRSDVTDNQYFGEIISPNCNADCCHHCRDKFGAAMRYPLMTAVDWGTGWGLASVCGECFKVASPNEIGPRERYSRECRGCGSPMLTVFTSEVCSNRCYQRDYRRRRRAGLGSTVDWKGHRSVRCAACEKPLCRWGGRNKRKHAVYCSNACRQKAYRRRGS